MAISTDDRKNSLKEISFILHNTTDVNMHSVYEFIYDVYVYGGYHDPKHYTKQLQKHLKTLDAAILELALNGAIIKSDQPSIANRLFALADIRVKIDGHEWRAKRIMEENGFG